MLKIRPSLFFTISTLVITGWLFPIAAEAQKMQCKLTVDPSVTLVHGHNNASAVRPGDTICLSPGQKTYLVISHLQGTNENPIVVTNIDGQVLITNAPNYGVKFDSCSHIKFSGKGISSIPYGIKINGAPGTGLSVDGLSTNIEIEGVEISNTGISGLIAKTEPNCTFTSTRDKFTLRGLIIHDNFIHHTGDEGMYIGSSKYKNGQTITCEGHDTVLFPHLLRGVYIYNNRVENTGWDGIQVSSADSGCFIHDNQVMYDSEEEELYQMSGILIGGGTTAACFNNTIRDGKGDGIDVVSLGVQDIYNNLIVNPGRTYKINQNYTPYLKHGIYVGPDYASPTNTYHLINNTIISPKSNGIRFVDSQSAKNIIANTIIINPGSYPTSGENAYINLASSSIDIQLLNNIKNWDFGTIEFINPGEGDFDLKSNSPAVNAGIDIEGFPLDFDILNRIRPFAVLPDIGAYECQDSSLLSIPESEFNNIIIGSIAPNPFSDQCDLEYTIKEKSLIDIGLYSILGEKVMNILQALQTPGKYFITIKRNSVKAGIFILIFQSGRMVLTQKVIILN